MANKCENCTEKCPQSERARQAALGRMYATNEFIALQKKVESGELVEVVRCKDCKHWFGNWYMDGSTEWHGTCHNDDEPVGRWESDFCSYGERKDND